MAPGTTGVDTTEGEVVGDGEGEGDTRNCQPT